MEETGSRCGSVGTGGGLNVCLGWLLILEGAVLSGTGHCVEDDSNKNTRAEGSGGIDPSVNIPVITDDGSGKILLKAEASTSEGYSNIGDSSSDNAEHDGGIAVVAVGGSLGVVEGVEEGPVDQRVANQQNAKGAPHVADDKREACESDCIVKLDGKDRPSSEDICAEGTDHAHNPEDDALPDEGHVERVVFHPNLKELEDAILTMDVGKGNVGL